MRKSADTTKRSKPATKRSKPTAQAGETTAQPPPGWTQLSFGLNVLTWQEEMKQKKRAQE